MRRLVLSYNMVNEHICSNFYPHLIKCGMTVEVLRCAPTGPKSGYSLVRIKGPSDLCEEELSDLKEKVGDWCSVELSKTAPGDYVALISNRDCGICKLVADAKCFLESVKTHDNGTVEWSVIGPDADTLNRLVGALNETGRKVTVHSAREQISSTALTYRQKEALKMAYDMGFFDIPQRITLEGLTPHMQCSKSTLNIMLRRAERKILVDYLSK